MLLYDSYNHLSFVNNLQFNLKLVHYLLPLRSGYFLLLLLLLFFIFWKTGNRLKQSNQQHLRTSFTDFFLQLEHRAYYRIPLFFNFVLSICRFIFNLRISSASNCVERILFSWQSKGNIYINFKCFVGFSFFNQGTINWKLIFLFHLLMILRLSRRFHLIPWLLVD